MYVSPRNVNPQRSQQGNTSRLVTLNFDVRIWLRYAQDEPAHQMYRSDVI